MNTMFPDIKGTLREALTAAMDDENVWTAVDEWVESYVKTSECHVEFDQNGPRLFFMLGEGDGATTIPLVLSGGDDYIHVRGAAQRDDVAGRINGIDSFISDLMRLKSHYQSLLENSPAD